MSTRFVFDGLEELKAEFRALPRDLTGEASHIVEAAANGAEASIKAAYPVRTGKLRDGMSTTFETSGFATGATIRNSSKLAQIFERGTQARHTAIGANRGSMPPGHVFVPRIIKARRLMYAQLKDLLQRHGLIVTGDA